MLLMATTSDEKTKNEEWFHDFGCSNHMTSHREWMASFDTSKKESIKLADSRKLVAEGTGNMVIISNDVKRIIIEDVMYIPEMKCNHMSIGQLVEKGFSVTMGGDSLNFLMQRRIWCSNQTCQRIEHTDATSQVRSVAVNS